MSLKVGDEIYIGTSVFLSHGEDDVIGGRAKVAAIITENNGWIGVEVEENPGTFYQMADLLSKQKELKKRYGARKAKKSPDNRPEFNCPYDYEEEDCPRCGKNGKDIL